MYKMSKKNFKQRYWTHPSIITVTKDGDPVYTIIEKAREISYKAYQQGWSGPPYDPFDLAELLKIPITLSDKVLDARVVPRGSKGFNIEVNPNRPQGRLRFSVAHEIAHTLFPDCNEYIRERLSRDLLREDDWQLELLCNICAAEFLMPVGSFPNLREENLNIDTLMELRKKYDVSTEALLIRVAKLTDVPCFVFTSSREKKRERYGKYRLDYVVSSKTNTKVVPIGCNLSEGSSIEECVAIGFTSKGNEKWPEIGDIHVESVGIPPYPSHLYPRVAGIVSYPKQSASEKNEIKYLKGDAKEPRGKDNKIIAFIVNDKALSWGAGFAREVQTKWPFVQKEFKEWVFTSRKNTLGNVHVSEIDNNIAAFKMICQHGYGPSLRPRIRYKSLETCLKQLAEEALRRNASVHMPRIGSGQAGGSWNVVSEIIEEKLCSVGVNVTVYDLPGRKEKKRESMHYMEDLFD